MSDILRTAGHRQVLALDESEQAEPLDAAAAPRDWVRRRAPWLLGVAVVALLGLLGVQHALDARDRARLAQLADIPGVLQPLPGRVDALWRWTPTTSASLVASDTASRWAIGTRYRPGSVELRGTDPDTGAVGWTTPFPIDDALPPDERGGFPSVWVRCTTAAAALHPVAVCGADLTGPGGHVGTPLIVLDPSDGTVLDQQTLPAGTLWTVTDGRLVIAAPIGFDRWHVRATSPTTGAELWQHVTGPVQPAIDPQSALTSDADRVLLTSSGHAWVWTPGGQSTADLQVAANGWTELGRGGTLVWNPIDGLVTPSGALVTETGNQLPVTGTQARLAVDDGSAAGVVLLRSGLADGTLVARDARSGAELWRAEGTTGQVIVVDGAVVATSPTSVVARDARTGVERWHFGLDAAPVYLGADPLRVVVLTEDGMLRGLDLADGRNALTADVDALTGETAGALESAQEYGGRLLVTLRDGSGAALG